MSASLAGRRGGAGRAERDRRAQGVERFATGDAKLRSEALADFLDAWEAEHGIERPTL